MLGGNSPLELVLWVLLLCAVLVGAYLALGRVMKLELILKRAGKFAKWRFVMDFLIWSIILINISFYINGWLGKGLTLFVGMAVALRIELARANAQMNRAKEQSKSQSKSQTKSRYNIKKDS